MKSPEQTKMVADTTETKLVKIKALRMIRLRRENDEGKMMDFGVKPGDVVEVSEAEAKEFCDRKFENVYAFSGERGTNDAEKGKIVRAERV